MPACLAAHETKYAHHGPTPEPAVAWRYWAMRGESLEPGGCSVWPTSALAAWIMACAPPPPAAGAGGVKAGGGIAAGAVGVKAVVAIAAVALAGSAAAVCAPSVAEKDVVGASAGAGGTRERSISAIRAITLSTLIPRVGRTLARGL